MSIEPKSVESTLSENSGLESQPKRTNLIFFASADPAVNPSPIISACHFASTARKAGLEAELRLAGDAVRVLDPEKMPPGADGERLCEALEKVRATQPRVSL